MPRTTRSAVPRYRLSITLDEIAPTIWRRFWIPGNRSLIALHHTIQAVMGWTDAHLHEFQIAGVRYATPDPDDNPDAVVVDERQTLLHKALNGISRFGYLYDFGDGWQHTLIVEDVQPLHDEDAAYAYIDAGARACPPEDAGGVTGYQGFLDQLAKNPKSRQVREFLRWAGEDFDPDRFDRHAANATLLRMAWSGWGSK